MSVELSDQDITLCNIKHENSSIIRKYEVHTRYQKHSTELAATMNPDSVSQRRCCGVERKFIYGAIQTVSFGALWGHQTSGYSLLPYSLRLYGNQLQTGIGLRHSIRQDNSVLRADTRHSVRLLCTTHRTNKQISNISITINQRQLHHDHTSE